MSDAADRAALKIQERIIEEAQRIQQPSRLEVAAIIRAEYADLVEAAKLLELAVVLHHTRQLTNESGEGLSEYILGPTRNLRAALKKVSP
jgi:hypothetical protein